MKLKSKNILEYVIRYLGASFLGNLLTGKGIERVGYGNHSQNKMDF